MVSSVVAGSYMPTPSGSEAAIGTRHTPPWSQSHFATLFHLTKSFFLTLNGYLCFSIMIITCCSAISFIPLINTLKNSCYNVFFLSNSHRGIILKRVFGLWNSIQLPARIGGNSKISVFFFLKVNYVSHEHA